MLTMGVEIGNINLKAKMFPLSLLFETSFSIALTAVALNTRIKKDIQMRTHLKKRKLYGIQRDEKNASRQVKQVFIRTRIQMRWRMNKRKYATLLFLVNMFAYNHLLQPASSRVCMCVADFLLRDKLFVRHACGRQFKRKIDKSSQSIHTCMYLREKKCYELRVRHSVRYTRIHCLAKAGIKVEEKQGKKDDGN